MTNNLAICSPVWREKAVVGLVYFNISPNARQSGEKKKLTLLNEGISKGVSRGIKLSNN